jgi:hypothetical protein
VKKNNRLTFGIAKFLRIQCMPITYLYPMRSFRKYTLRPSARIILIRRRRES